MIIPVQFVFNCPSGFREYADRKSKMAATTGHNINTGPYGENTEIYSSLKLLH
jgi:sulfate adenylyltransferase subunit 1 (EFTu-like GTPase family)